jgi:hypothetical protein
MDDLGLAHILLGRMRPGGHILFHTDSLAFDKADAIAATLEGEKKLMRERTFKSLLVCGKLP